MCNTYKYILTCKWDTFGDEFSAHEIRLCIYFNGDDAPRLVLQKQECPPKLLPNYFLNPISFFFAPCQCDQQLLHLTHNIYCTQMSYNTCKAYYQFVTTFIGTMHHEVTIGKFVNKYCMKLVMKLGIIIIIMFCNDSSFW
jgi:hypothetical protein